MILDIAAAACLILGALLCLAAGIGLLRFPDVLSRAHSATKPQVLGLLLILIAVALRLRNIADLPTLGLIAIFQMATAPVAAHMLGRAAYRTKALLPDRLMVDELAGREHALKDSQRP